MDYLLNDEIFDHGNDELLQSPEIESELWQNDLVSDLHNENQFFNDQEFDLNQFSLSFDDDNKLQNKFQTNANIFQVSPEIFPRGVSPVRINVNDGSLKPSMRTITLFHKRKSSLDIRDKYDPGHTESKKYFCDNILDNPFSYDQDRSGSRHKSAFNSTKLTHVGDDLRILNKFKKPDNASIIQEAHNLSSWGGRLNTERMKYSLSPSTNSPESAIDCSLNMNGLNHGTGSRDITPLSHSNALHSRFYELKYKPHRDDSYSTRISNNPRLFQSPIPHSGVLILTEEEKRTLLLEGYQIPSRLPLTKHEERNLKKVRRKIKNKISAQESRRKKKEYMEALEKKVEIYASENNDLRKKLENQETANKSLVGQLRHLQHMLGRASSNTTSTCVMVFILCFSLIFVGVPDINQPMELPQSMIVVRNIHKMGYGSPLRRERSHMTSMQRYFPPDIDGFVNISYDIKNNFPRIKESTIQNKGNEPFNSLESAASGQRRSILLGNIKEEDDECVQYGPRYLWWLLQSPTFNADESVPTTSILVTDHSDLVYFSENVITTVMSISESRMKNESNRNNHGLNISFSSNEALELAVNVITT